MACSSIIDIAGLTHSFGGNRVLDQFSLQVNTPVADELAPSVCVMGPNGAGKSTLLNLLTGFLRPIPSATASVLGTSIRGLTAEQIALLGVSRSFQGARDVVPQLSVITNLLLIPSLRAKPWWSRLAHHHRWAELVGDARARIEECLHEFGCEELGQKLDRPADELSFGWKRILGALRIHISGAKLVMLDEPFAGLDPQKTKKVQNLILSWRKHSRTLIFVEHIRSSAMRAVIEETASRVVLLNQGRVVLDGTPGETLSNPAFAQVYTGPAATSRRGAERIMPNPLQEARTATLMLSSVSASYDGAPALRSVNVSVSNGQHLLLVGPNGAGKSTLLATVFRIGLKTKGKISYGQLDIEKTPPCEVARKGIGFVSQKNRVFGDLTVLRNLAIATLGHSATERQKKVRRVSESFPLLDSRLGQIAATLSGGEQAQLALALALARDPKVLLADEISVGLDAGRARALMVLLKDWVGRGLALMTAEQFYRPALENCDHVVALRDGEIAWQGRSEDFTEERQRKLFSGLDL